VQLLLYAYFISEYSFERINHYGELEIIILTKRSRTLSKNSNPICNIIYTRIYDNTLNAIRLVIILSYADNRSIAPDGLNDDFVLNLIFTIRLISTQNNNNRDDGTTSLESLLGANLYGTG